MRLLTKGSFLLLLFSIYFTILLLNGCSSSENDKQKRYNNAIEYINKGNKDAAILELKSAIQLDPKFSDARYRLGLLYLENKQTKLAFGEFIRAADLNPENLDANLKVAQFYFLAKQPENAQKYLNGVLAKEANNKDAIILQTNIYMVEKQYERALETLATLGDEVSSSTSLQNLKGQILLLQKNFPAAEESFNKAIASEPTNIISYKNLLKLYASTNRLDDSKKLLDQMLEKFPDNPEPHLLLAGYYKKQNLPDKVANELSAIVQLAPDNPRFTLLLADHYFTSGKPSKAIATLQEAQKTIPDNLDILAQLATFYFDTKEFDKAKEINTQIKAKQADFGAAKLIDARFLQQEGKIRDSIALLNNLSNDFPNWPEPYYFLGLSYLSSGDLQLAAQSTGTAISKAKGVPKYHALMAQLYLMQKDFENARNEAIISLKLNPRNLRSAIILSQALVGAKDYEKAAKILTDINKQIPGNPEILGNLAMASFSTNDVEKGKKLLGELLEKDPGNPQAILMLIGLNYKDNLDGAKKFVQSQIDKAPTDERLYLILGRIDERLENNTEALAAFEKVKELNPNNPEAYLLAARLLKKMGQLDDAMGKYREIIEKQPNSLSAHMGIASLLEIQGDTAKAAEQYETILKIDEHYAPAANNLAYIITKSGNGDMGKALMLAMIAKQALPNDPHVSDTLGFVHYKREAYPLAIAQYETALQSSPDEPTISYHLAQALAADKQDDKARDILKKTLASSSDFSEKQEAQQLLNKLLAN